MIDLTSSLNVSRPAAPCGPDVGGAAGGAPDFALTLTDLMMPPAPIVDTATVLPVSADPAALSDPAAPAGVPFTRQKVAGPGFHLPDGIDIVAVVDGPAEPSPLVPAARTKPPAVARAVERHAVDDPQDPPLEPALAWLLPPPPPPPAAMPTVALPVAVDQQAPDGAGSNLRDPRQSQVAAISSPDLVIGKDGTAAVAVALGVGRPQAIVAPPGWSTIAAATLPTPASRVAPAARPSIAVPAAIACPSAVPTTTDTVDPGGSLRLPSMALLPRSNGLADPAARPLRAGARQPSVAAQRPPAIIDAAAAPAPAPLTIPRALDALAIATTPAAPRRAADLQPLPSLVPIAAAAPSHIVAAADGAQGTGIDLTRDPGLHGMIDRIETLRDAAADGGARDTRIRLIPDALGLVDVAVRRDGDRVHVHFTAAEAGTRQLITEAQPRLTDLAEARGIRIDRTTVDGGASQGGHAGAGQQSSRQPLPMPARPTPARAVADDDDTHSDHRIA